MKAAFGFALICLLGSPLLLANGGGYFRGGVEQAGDVFGFEPEATDKIRMLDEKLTVSLGDKEADVEIRYLMRNVTDKKVKVRFGFPVEESLDSDLMEEGDAIPQNDKAGAKKLQYCQNYRITASGKPVDADWKGEPKPAQNDKFKGIAGWLISEITFAPNEEKPVAITFRSSYPLEEWAVSDDTSTSPALFKYRLSTAACWAGTIGTGRIVLKPNGIIPSELKVIKPVNRFKKEGNDWVWNFENLEPALADDLEIEARPKERSYSEFTERGGQWSVSHSNYTIKASSTLKPGKDTNYSAENVKNYEETVWSEGAPGPGIGEWLELKPEVPKPLTAIDIRPGFWKYAGENGPNLFKANSRPKTILVELNGEHGFSVQVPDKEESLKIRIAEYTKPVKTVRLTFTDVWKGDQYDDLCISLIRLDAKLDKKPKIQQAR